MALTFTPGYWLSHTPKAVHAGDQSISGVTVIPNSTTAVPSAGDVGYLAKLPNGAIIVEFREDHTCADTIGLDFGLATGTDAGDSTYSSLITAGAKATINRATVLNNSDGILVSLSDSDPNGYAILACKVASGSLTASCTIRWTCIYRMDGVKLS